MIQKITPFLWFDGRAEEAAKFYVGIFAGSRIGNVMRWPEDGPGGKKGDVLSIDFELEGQGFAALNGGPAFQFTPAISFFVSCETQAEIDRYWDRLLDGGSPQQCGWVSDRFGVSWQIVPRQLGDYLRDPDGAKSRRVMEAMMSMVKLDLPTLTRAYEGR